MTKLVRLLEVPRSFKIEGSIDGEADQNKVINAQSEVIEVCLERLDFHRDHIDAHDARLAAIEERLGLKVYAVAPEGEPE